jgi:hypothetical protein
MIKMYSLGEVINTICMFDFNYGAAIIDSHLFDLLKVELFLSPKLILFEGMGEATFHIKYTNYYIEKHRHTFKFLLNYDKSYLGVMLSK